MSDSTSSAQKDQTGVTRAASVSGSETYTAGHQRERSDSVKASGPCLCLEEGSVTGGTRIPRDDNPNERESVHETLNRLHGRLINHGGKDGKTLSFNQVRAAAEISVKGLIAHDEARGFLVYHQDTGLWRKRNRAEIKIASSLVLRELARMIENGGSLERTIKNYFLNDIVDLVEGVGSANFGIGRREGLIHLGNCVLDTTIAPFRVLDFSPEFKSTQQIPINYDPKARCPEYLAWLAETMSPDDQRLWQDSCGQVLSGFNTFQKILLLLGVGGSGKGQLVNLLRGIIGDQNCLEIRTRQLDRPFEAAKMIDKTLLLGSDVPANFLTNAAAGQLKKFTGHDLISAERKNSNGSVLLTGEYCVIITANTKLRVRIEGDVEAWRRRLMVIEFEKVVENPTPYFGRRLLEAEGPGILNWMLQGLRQLRANNGFSVTNDQRARVNELLEASDTVGEFISEMLHFDRPDADVTTEELVEAHARYCHRRGWTSRSDEVVTKRIHSVMRELHGVTTVRHDIVRGNTERRGYKGFALDTEPYESDTY